MRKRCHTVGPVEIAQAVKCLLCSHEAPAWIPSTHIKVRCSEDYIDFVSF